MKSVLRMRHYCDFCKKSTGTKPSMEKHEKACTANPARVCRMCSFAGLAQLSMSELQVEYAKGFKALQTACEGCPACMLATMRQHWDGVVYDSDVYNDGRDAERGEWDFKKASQAWIEDHRPEDTYGGYCG
ncbi:hypothetical protein [Variovorax boronicumulans]|uniref:hypothetical protein n=1 Tax=Variovorax boronicumulans TaxID=436515 RepID=UPI0012E4FF25|nr:hypothetical protein [Variovorax boronicumulans]GER21279.1 hypothetical protein VCH24_63260 [Variovorax boronicumulans]